MLPARDAIAPKTTLNLTPASGLFIIGHTPTRCGDSPGVILILFS
jgi:hypothetical protein